jgi:hypothetical protein
MSVIVISHHMDLLLAEIAEGEAEGGVARESHVEETVVAGVPASVRVPATAVAVVAVAVGIVVRARARTPTLGVTIPRAAMYAPVRDPTAGSAAMLAVVVAVTARVNVIPRDAGWIARWMPTGPLAEVTVSRAALEMAAANLTVYLLMEIGRWPLVWVYEMDVALLPFSTFVV